MCLQRLFSWFYLVPVWNLGNWTLTCQYVLWQKPSRYPLGKVLGSVFETRTVWVNNISISFIFDIYLMCDFSLEIRSVRTAWPVYKYPFWSQHLTLQFIYLVNNAAFNRDREIDFREVNHKQQSLNCTLTCSFVISAVMNDVLTAHSIQL